MSYHIEDDRVRDMGSFLLKLKVYRVEPTPGSRGAGREGLGDRGVHALASLPRRAADPEGALSGYKRRFSSFRTFN
jgi:hypothetical protein